MSNTINRAGFSLKPVLHVLCGALSCSGMHCRKCSKAARFWFGGRCENASRILVIDPGWNFFVSVLLIFVSCFGMWVSSVHLGGRASDLGEPRSAWWAGGIMLLFVSVCLAGVVGSGCCWLSHVRHNKCLTVLVFCFASGCTKCFRCYYGVIPVVVRVDPCGCQGGSLGLFRAAACDFFFNVFYAYW